MLATSLRAKLIVKRNSGTLMTAYRLIRDNFRALKKGRFIATEEMSIERAATGKFKGKKNIFTLLVKTREFGFFVKVFRPRAEVDVLRGLRLLEEELRHNHYSIEGVRMTPLRPLLVYEDLVGKRSFLVSGFLEKSEAEQVSHMKKSKLKDKLEGVILRFGTRMEALHDVWEIAPVNAFYHKEKDTVYLFDIYHFVP